MSAAQIDLAPEETLSNAIVGWRVWRLLEIDTLDGGKTLRLAAAGTNGNPRFWQPREATVASCSVFEATHEAPWPDCGCGLYALRTRRLNEERLDAFCRYNENGSLAWVVGRVSLWGRVVECERGWRGQYAYPYSLTVLSDDDTLGGRLASVYAVDVERAEPVAVEASTEQDVLEDTLAEIDDLELQLTETRQRIAAYKGKAVTPPAPPSTPAATEALPFSTEVTRDDVLIAFYLNAARKSKYRGLRAERRNIGELGELTSALLGHRGLPANSDRHGRNNPLGEAHRDVATRIRGELAAMRKEGLVESGLLRYSSYLYWSLTTLGLDQLATLRPPKRIRFIETWGDRGEGWSLDGEVAIRERVDPEKLLAFLAAPRAPWETEIRARRAEWAAERAAARAKGDRALGSYYRRMRKGDEFGEVRLYYTEEEMLDGVRAAVEEHAGQPVTFTAVMEKVAPGDYSQREAANASQVLVRLRKAGMVDRTDGSPKLWSVKEGVVA